MDDLHLQADLLFGPCDDPDCPGAKLATGHFGRPLLELVWPTGGRQSLIDGGEKRRDRSLGARGLSDARDADGIQQNPLGG